MNKKTSKKIQNIVSPIYKKYKERLYKTQFVAPDIRQINIDKANDPTLPEYERRRHQNLVDAGVFDHKEQVIDEDAAAEYEKEVEAAMDAAIQSGELPKPKTPAIMKKLKEKSKQHAKRTAKGGKPTK